METVLKTTALTKKFGNKIAVNNVDMNVEKGDIYGFIGRNGAGKTTFMKTVLGMVNKTSGDYTFFETGTKYDHKRVGCLIEDPSLYLKHSAIENMKRYAILFGRKDDDLEGILDFVGLGDVKKLKVKKFSLGMKQRLGIAIAMIGQPELMVLDEPLNGLDPAGIVEVRDLIIRLNKEKKVTFIISSHLLEELSKVATKFGIINNGVLIEEFSAEDMETKFERRTIFTVDKVEEAIEFFKEQMDKKYIRVKDNNIMLLSGEDKRAEYNKALIEKGIMVSDIHVTQESLESYFMGKVEA